MGIQKVKISDLVYAGYNPRRMSEHDFEALKNSIKEFGLVEPIVVNKDLTIIGGHQRARACQELGLTEVDTIQVDLTKEKEKLLNLALNKIVGEWEEKKLASLISTLNEAIPDNINLTGFDDKDLNRLLTEAQLFSEDFGELKETELATPKEAIDRGERVPLTFWAETQEEYNIIHDYFKTNRKDNLDTKKLIDLINKNGEAL